jgi:hypothetical protein
MVGVGDRTLDALVDLLNGRPVEGGRILLRELRDTAPLRRLRRGAASRDAGT